jgi:RHS repeat-associated protein
LPINSFFPESSRATDPVVRYYHHDHLGTIRAITDATGSPEGTETHDFYPFGAEITSNLANTDQFLFTGKQRDTETGLDYFLARYYSTKTNRFNEIDPITSKLDAIYNPKAWNLYLYCENNPIMFKDPSGKRVEVFARRVQYTLGSLAHTFIRINPDNPEDFGGNTSWTISGYEGDDGMLHTMINWPNDVNWQNNIKGSWVINLPEGVANDTEFIKRIMEAYERYISGSRKYNFIPWLYGYKGGNCHSITSGALIGAGVSLNFIKNINPSGANAGWGNPLHEMLPVIFWDMFNYFFGTNLNFGLTGNVSVYTTYLNI